MPGTTFQRDGRVYLRRQCPEHGVIEALVSSSRRHYYLRDEVPHPPPAGSALPSSASGTEAKHQLPILSRLAEAGGGQSSTSCGCGPGPGHRTCVALLEITGACNLRCPVCFAGSSGGSHRPATEVCADLEAFLAARGPLDVLQLSGGEPLLHPELLAIIDHCRRLPIEQVVINTNGLELAGHDGLAAELAARRPRLELSLQLDGLDAASHLALRGVDLSARKRAVLDAIVRHDLPTNLACTVVRGVNEGQLGALLAARPGNAADTRHHLPAGDLERAVPTRDRPDGSRHHGRRDPPAWPNRAAGCSAKTISGRCPARTRIAAAFTFVARRR